MATAPRIQLKGQVAYRRHDDGAIVVIQLWTGFVRSRAAMVTITDGLRTSMRAGTLKQISDAYRFHTLPAAKPLTIVDARVKLTARGMCAAYCTVESCQAMLPIGSQWCAGCGTPYGARQK